MVDYDKEQWQAEQIAQDEVQTAYREKMAKARDRSARNARRKIARLHAKLTELGHISDFEDEFGESVLERLEKYGSAFHDLEKGRAGDALSAAQKQVVARMNKKVKELKAKRTLEPAQTDPDAEYSRTAGGWGGSSKKGLKPKTGFGHKNFTPRVRQIEEDMPSGPDVDFSDPKIKPFIPKYEPEPMKSSPSKKPFLRLVRSED